MQIKYHLFYSDRLIDHPNSWQARKYIPMIVRTSSINGTITFNDFVQFLIQTSPEEYDSHWARIKDHCQPELIHYDALINMETLEYDMMDIFNVTDTDDLFTDNNYTRSTNEELTKAYFQDITRKDTELLFEIYKDDFLFFNYTLQP